MHLPQLFRAVLPSLWLTTAAVLLALPTGCSPLVRPAPFKGFRDVVTDASLLGPFDGQILDAATGEPVADATIVAVWSYDHGDGFIAPRGSDVIEAVTDEAGRYRIPECPQTIDGNSVRLVGFELLVYKRGFLAYRSGELLDGRPRTDFTVRHNRIELEKWRETDSHAEHLMYVGAPKAIQKEAFWEQDIANLELYRQLGGQAPGDAANATNDVGAKTPKAVDDTPKVAQLLEASELLTPADVQTRTHYSGTFTATEPSDLRRTSFYHGIHLKADDHDASWDLIYRVWSAPPGGMAPVIETIEETLPGVKPSGEVTDQTWVFATKGVYAVAFIDPDENVGVLLTCGDQQCADLDTAIILAKTVQRNLDKLDRIDAPNELPTETPEPEPTTESQP